MMSAPPVVDAGATSTRFRTHPARLLPLIVLVGIILMPGHAVAAQREEGPYRDGCYHIFMGTAETGARCPQSDGSNFYYDADGQGGYRFVMQCLQTPSYQACLFTTWLYVETYTDGSSYIENAGREYMILNADGSMAEYGAYNASGVQLSSRYAGGNAMALRNRSMMDDYMTQFNVVSIVTINPTAFDGIVNVNTGTQYLNCLHLNDSRTDFDRDGYTGFSELAEYCAG